MALTKEQQRVASRIINIGRRRNESRKEIIAALVTGITEANLTNPNYGDRDSVGWRQARSHYGSVQERLRLGPSIKGFYKETSGVAGAKGMTPGTLAQTVQRSAFPERYDTHRGEAKQILRSLSGATGASVAGRTPKRKVKVAGAVDRSQERSLAALDFIRKEDKTAADYKDIQTTLTSLKNQPAQFKTVGGKKLPVDKQTKKGKIGGKEGSIVGIGRMAESMGLNVGEHPKFGGVGGGHADESLHYSNRAIDVSGDTVLMKRFAKMVARRYGKRLAELFWNGPGAINIDNGKRVEKFFVSGHTIHVHVAL